MNPVQRALAEAREQAFDGMASRMGIVGWGVAFIPGVLVVPFGNIITTAGDQYYARKAVQGIGTPNGSAPSPATGMKLGTGTTTAAKSGAGAANLGTYITGSNDLFDTTHPTVAAHTGTNTGWDVTYQCTWAAGTATNAAITEVVLVNDAATNGTSTEANTYARSIFSPTVSKGATQPLIVIWNHTFLGA